MSLMIFDEHTRDYIKSLSEGFEGELLAMRNEALKKNVPIIRDDAAEFLRFLIRTRKPENILEVGTATGFSASVMAECAGDAKILTIEKVKMRLADAKKNLKDKENVTLLVGDATHVLPFLAGDANEGAACSAMQQKTKDLTDITEPPVEEIYTGGRSYKLSEYSETFGKKMPHSSDILMGTSKFDLVFLDAAKGQYMTFLEPITRLLAPGGILVADNVLADGIVAQPRYTVTRRDRTIHERMREFLFYLTHCDEYDTTILPIADGMSVSVKR